MNKTKLKTKRYTRRRLRVKSKLVLEGKHRLCISRSNKNFYAQLIDDATGTTVVGKSTLAKDFPKQKNCGNIAAAQLLGKAVAEAAVAKGIKKVVFDRNGFLYHGKIKAFADAARENGLEF